MTETGDIPQAPGQPGDEIRHLQGCLIAAVAGLALLVALGQFPVLAGRLAAFVLFAAQIWLEARRGQRLFLMSPPFLLSAVALFAYSLVPVGMYFLLLGLEGGQQLSFSLAGGYRPGVVAYFGSDAERLVLAFALAGLAVHGIVRWRWATGPENLHPAAAQKTEHAAPLLLAISAGLLVIFILGTFFGIFGASRAALLRTAFGPIQSFLLLYLSYCAFHLKTLNRAAVIALGLVTVLVMIAATHGKIPVLIVMSAIIFWTASSRISFAGIAKTALVFAVFLVVVMQLIQIVRAPHASMVDDSISMLRSAGYVAASKLIWRQTETGHCFNEVIKRHRDDKFVATKQTFWLEILVPRVVWPSKPNFSLGNVYARTYCGMPEKNTLHSASITLLGQTFIHGGNGAALLHGAIVLATLGLASMICFNGTVFHRVIVFALLPWWIDFDQHFALYVGNLVKFGIIMLPFMLLASGRFDQYLPRRAH